MAIALPVGGFGVVGAATPAGTLISNTAQIDYLYAGTTVEERSNRVDIRVGEIIDFSVTPAPQCGRPAAANSDVAIGFLITNLGNGSEAFIPGTPLVRGGSNFVVRAVVEDSNDNGCYDPGIDRTLPPGQPTRPLAPGGTTIVFVVGTGGNGIGEVVLPVTSSTGSGATGTAIPGRGDGGGDAVIGPSTGKVDDGAAPLPAGSLLQASLVKTQNMRVSQGGAPQKGTIVTYSMEAGFSGSGIASGVVIADAIPAGTD
ncbi:MAG: hypothetical protein EOP61_35670, partial [Sphingomonadales bacterium]